MRSIVHINISPSSNVLWMEAAVFSALAEAAFFALLLGGGELSSSIFFCWARVPASGSGRLSPSKASASCVRTVQETEYYQWNRT